MYASTDRKDFARDILIPLIESEVSKRKKVMLPTDEQMSQGVRIASGTKVYELVEELAKYLPEEYRKLFS